MKNFNTIVIGAGVAGLSTAHHLAKKGQKNILVLEKEKEKHKSHAPPLPEIQSRYDRDKGSKIEKMKGNVKLIKDASAQA